MEKLSFIIAVLLATLLGCTQQAQVVPVIPKPQPTEVAPPPHANTEIPIVATVTTKPSKIAFVRNYSDYYGWDIFTANQDGTDIKRITKSASKDAHPVWSPGGQQIAFESIREWHGLPSIYIMDSDGNNVKCLTPERKYCGLPSWSPNGKIISYCIFKSMSGGRSGSNIFIPDTVSLMDSNGNNKRELNNGWYPNWLPDNQRIAFFANQPGIIYVSDIDGSNTREYLTGLKTSYLSNSYPTLSVSPNGKSLVLSSQDFTGKWDIYFLSLDSTKINKLTGNISGSCYSPTWSPDGSKIAFTLEKESSIDIYVINSDGSNPVLLIKDGMFPSWQR